MLQQITIIDRVQAKVLKELVTVMVDCLSSCGCEHAQFKQAVIDNSKRYALAQRIGKTTKYFGSTLLRCNCRAIEQP